MAIVIRTDDVQPDDATLIIHGGAGGIEFVRRAAISNYAEYRAIRGDGYGHFTVSVFATIHDIEEQAIVERLVHGSYGVATLRDVSIAFSLIPTSDDDPELSEDIRWLQDYHFDICLPDLLDDRLLTIDPVDDTDLLATCEAHITPHLEAVLGLFTRHQKQ
jgi:hypothetical protein